MISARAAVAATGALLFFCGFAALGTWQLERRVWKLALIARVEERVHAPAAPAPESDRWPRVDRAHDEYRHVQATGTYLGSEVLVQATTQLGPGFWVLTPLRLEDGAIIVVNRGFVPPERRDPAAHAARPGSTIVTGLLRISEPGGVWPRRNDPAANRWYSRDIEAIATARELRRVAPYFIDADGSDNGDPTAPTGGLTVVSFYNNHLVYALTWYTLALMIPCALWFGIRDRHRRPM